METDGSPSVAAASPTSAWIWFDRIFIGRKQAGLPTVSSEGELKDSLIWKAKTYLNDMSGLLAGKSWSLSCTHAATN